MVIDLHSHSTISDGTLSIEEVLTAAERRGYAALAITDHIYESGDPAEIIGEVRRQVERLRGETPVRLLAGAEITECSPDHIPEMARRARELGAEVVVVHGECVSMDVPPGTNAVAVRSADVNILGHPGLITVEDAREAARRGVYLELSARSGHSWGNGHVYGMARQAGAGIIVDSDAHDEMGLLSAAKVMAVLRGAGASTEDARRIVDEGVPALLRRLLSRAAPVS